MLRQPPPPPQRLVQCYHCHRAVSVPEKATTVSCPRCAGGIRVDDILIDSDLALSPIRTCGVLIISRRGRLSCTSAEARLGVHVLGQLSARVLSGGPVIIGPRAVWNGDCTAARIVIHPGATIVGGQFCILNEDRASRPHPSRPRASDPPEGAGVGTPPGPALRLAHAASVLRTLLPRVPAQSR